MFFFLFAIEIDTFAKAIWNLCEGCVRAACQGYTKRKKNLGKEDFFAIDL